MDARAYWNSFYKDKSKGTKEQTSEFLKSMLPRLSKGSALELAMGEGANAVYLASNGFQVTGFDVSDVAVEKAKELAIQKNVKIEAKQRDLDMHVFGLMEFDTIAMINFKPSISRYYNEIIRSLKQGGTLIIEAPMISEMQEAIGKGEVYKDFYFHSNELLREIRDNLRILYYSEANVGGHHMLQCLALKPVDKDAQKFNLFNMSSKDAVETSKSSKQIELAEQLFKK
jgi:tellurite methyltransferase